MTAFTELPDMGSGIRMVGSTVMDEEQFTVEGWHLDRGEWRATLSGLQRYGALRRQRQLEKRSTWQARVDREEEYSSSMSALIDEGANP